MSRYLYGSILLLLCCTLFIFCAKEVEEKFIVVELTESQEKALMDRAQAYSENFVGKKAEALADFVIPESFQVVEEQMVDSIGGRERAINELNAFFNTNTKMVLGGFDFDPPASSYSYGTLTFSKMRTNISITVDSNQVGGPSEMLALSRDNGKTWFFTENDFIRAQDKGMAFKVIEKIVPRDSALKLLSIPLKGY